MRSSVLARGTNGTFRGLRKHRALQTRPTVGFGGAQGGPDSIMEIPAWQRPALFRKATFAEIVEYRLFEYKDKHFYLLHR